MTPVISVESLGKCYTLSESARTPWVNRVGEWASTRGKSATPPMPKEHWALREVGFELAAGEILGVIGANGSGKSTLLKLLGQVVHPTEGSILLRGRVATVIELGVGLDPELTGEENIFFYGSLLGMTHAQVSARFRDITRFSNLESFLAWPVKRYSSGMAMRLAFSVAIQTEADILLLDEALAVGDHEFSLKCRQRLRERAAQGLTVVLADHNRETILEVASRCALLEKGRLLELGSPRQLLARYETRRAHG